VVLPPSVSFAAKLWSIMLPPVALVLVPLILWRRPSLWIFAALV